MLSKAIECLSLSLTTYKAGGLVLFSFELFVGHSGLYWLVRASSGLLRFDQCRSFFQ